MGLLGIKHWPHLQLPITNVWFQKISIPPPKRVTGNLEGEGVLKAKFLNECLSLSWNFSEGWGVQTKKPSVGGEGWIFSRLTQYTKIRPGVPILMY